MRRVFDLILASTLAIILSPVMFIIACLIFILDGRPIFYKSERMKSFDEGFTIWKFRTMRVSAFDKGVSGAYKFSRITRCGHILRSSRLDELPQLLNILRGDMTFVGPRPPLRHYVDMYPGLYQQVLKERPGVTGYATLMYHKEEEDILAKCVSAFETEQKYCDICIPKKAALDLMYSEYRTFFSDAILMLATVFRRINVRLNSEMSLKTRWLQKINN